MNGKSKKFSRFWRELKHRKTDRVIVAYAASAFVILQLAQILEDALSLPEWITPLVIIVLAVGFPVSAVFSWFFDITPGGIEKTRPYSERSKNKIETQLKTWRWTTLASFIVIIALICFNVIRDKIESNEIKRTKKSIAVLPFDNFASSEAFPFTVDAITSIITSDLKKVEFLDVSQKWLVSEFAAKNNSVEDLARKLGVFFIVTGEVVGSKDQVIVNVDLNRVYRNRIISVWGDSFEFDPNGNMNNLSKIAVKIIENLKFHLSAEEKTRIRKRPTVNAAAFLNYMEGSNYQEDAKTCMAYLSSGDSIFRDLSIEKSFDRAMLFYDKAIQADSTFAEAYAKRAITRALGYRAGHFTAEEHLEKCRDDIKHALHFDKDLVDARIAYGFFFYYFIKDNEKALEYFREVSSREPKNWEGKFYMALVLRAMGDWHQSLNLMAQVGKSDIRDPLILTNIGLSYHAVHKYDSAIYYHDKAISVLPRWSAPYHNKIEALLLRDGNTKEAEVVLDTAVVRTTGGYFPLTRIVFDLYNGRFHEALLKAEVTGPSDFTDQGSRFLLLAEIHTYLNNMLLARDHYKSAFDFYSKLLADNPDNPEILSLLGISAAGLNDRIRAVEAGQKALGMTVNDRLSLNDRKKDLARIYVMTGENSKCLKILEDILNSPSDFSYKMLLIDPVWRPLKGTPEFNKLIETYSLKN